MSRVCVFVLSGSFSAWQEGCGSCLVYDAQTETAASEICIAATSFIACQRAAFSLPDLF